MTSLVFSDYKDGSFKGLPATHWTNDNMKHCAYAQGRFKTDIVQAAKESFNCEYTSRYGDECEYIDGEGLLSGQSVSVKVWGLVEKDNKYYWNGEVKTVTFKIDISIEYTIQFLPFKN